MKKVLLLSAAALLTAVLMYCNEASMSGAFYEPALRATYGAGYLLQAPARILLSAIDNRAGHHWALLSKLVAFASIPCVLAILWYAYQRFRSRVRALSPAPDASRRVFLIDSAAALGACGAAGTYYHTAWGLPGALVLRQYTIDIQGLPPAFDGLRIAHLSDTHYGPLIPLSFLRHVIRKTNELKPDLTLLTGDYVHQTKRAIPEGIGVLQGLQARLGMAAVLGNHNHWEDASACRDAFKRASIPLLDNHRLFLAPDGIHTEQRGGEALVLAGLADLWCQPIDPGRALGNLDPSLPRIVLAHNPDTAEQLPPNLRIDLMLSGHTHGGQVLLPGIGAPWAPTRYGLKYLGGRCQGPQCPVIVSRGIGMAALPIRVGVPSEIVLITLIRKADDGIALL